MPDKAGNAGVASAPEVITERETMSAIIGTEMNVDQTFNIKSGVRRIQGIDESHVEYMHKYFTLVQRLKRQGTQAYTILNLSPELITGKGVMLNHMFIKPVEPGKLYTKFVVRDYLIDRRAGLDKNDEPVAFMPAEIAYDFQLHYDARGCIVIYAGSHDPESDPKVKAMIVTQTQKLIHYARTRKKECDLSWGDPNIRGKSITDLDRAYVAWLIQIGEIDKKERPQWLDETRAESNRGDDCRRCGAATIKTTTTCSQCGDIHNPRKAYEDGDIDVEHQAILRLSRPVLEEMGISELIDETVDERKLREKAAAIEKRKGKGEPKK